MRQLLMNSNGVVVARMPRPVVQAGSVLVRVRYSLVSVGTELAPLRAPGASAPELTPLEQGLERARVLKQYFRASLRNPRKAANRLSQIAERRFSRAFSSAVPAAAGAAVPAVSDRQAQGWPIGYSVAGEVVGVGAGVDDFAAGDAVAAAGAGQANHADYVNVPRNLVCRVPKGCRAFAAPVHSLASVSPSSAWVWSASSRHNC